MSTVTVSEKGQVVIPAEIRRELGITPGCQLDLTLEGTTIRVELKRRVRLTRPEDGYGLLLCTQPGVRRLSDLDIAQTMQKEEDDNP